MTNKKTIIVVCIILISIILSYFLLTNKSFNMEKEYDFKKKSFEITVYEYDEDMNYEKNNETITFCYLKITKDKLKKVDYDSFVNFINNAPEECAYHIIDFEDKTMLYFSDNNMEHGIYADYENDETYSYNNIKGYIRYNFDEDKYLYESVK